MYTIDRIHKVIFVDQSWVNIPFNSPREVYEAHSSGRIIEPERTTELIIGISSLALRFSTTRANHLDGQKLVSTIVIAHVFVRGDLPLCDLAVCDNIVSSVFSKTPRPPNLIGFSNKILLN
ncbi:hypothetical protein DMUE_4450 [Dictyocoela muelleri]|nr:hypothetical protein DMUE_4450 [Dictyocoela muelleri]